MVRGPGDQLATFGIEIDIELANDNRNRLDGRFDIGPIAERDRQDAFATLDLGRQPNLDDALAAGRRS